MNELKIKKGSPQFLRALDKPEEIEKWWLENSQVPGICFIGRSNVGKSSLINSLFGQKTAKTSKTPGRTQKVNIFSFCMENDEAERFFYLYDLPGYGHAQVSRSMGKQWAQMMESFLGQMNFHTYILNIQDARHPAQKSDLTFYEYVSNSDLEMLLVFNKIDKLKKQKERSALSKRKKEFRETFPKVQEIHYVSAETKTGLDNLESTIVNNLIG